MSFHVTRLRITISRSLSSCFWEALEWHTSSHCGQWSRGPRASANNKSLVGSWVCHTVALEVAPSDNSKIHVTISNVYVLCNNVYDISIFRLILNLIDMCVWLVRMVSVNAGSPCEIHRTDPCIDSKIMCYYYIKMNTCCKPRVLSSSVNISTPLSGCYF